MLEKKKPALDWSDDHMVEDWGPSKTQQEYKDDCDIALQMHKAQKTRQLRVKTNEPKFGDFTGIESFQEAQNLVIQTRDIFGKLPAEIQKMFGHSPQALIEWLDNPDNNDEAVKLGLKPKVLKPNKNKAPETVPEAPEPEKTTDFEVKSGDKKE